MAELYIARQPIMDRNRQLIGYEFFYRNEKGLSDSVSPRAMTASVMVSLLNQIGLKAGAGDGKIFVNVDTSILQSDLLLSAPTGPFVFEITAHEHLGNKEREMLQMYHKQGYRFALDNLSTALGIPESLKPLLPYIDYVKFNTTATDPDLLPPLLVLLEGKKLIAERVEIPDVFEAYLAMGFDFFQGYFFAKPSLIRHNRIDPKHLGLVKIYNMLINGTPIEEVGRELRNHNELMLQLLQYLGSTDMSDPYPNRSVEEILQKVGTDRLTKWLMMIIYSKSSQTIETDKSPFSKLVEQRIDIMKVIIQALHPIEEEKMIDQARLLAFISLMEPILDVPMRVLLDQIRVDQIIEDALLTHTGKLGRVFALCLAVEKDDYAAAMVLMNNLSLAHDLYTTLRSLKKI